MIGGGVLKEPFGVSFKECRKVVKFKDQYLFKDCANLLI
jgi:hypothetical protein